MSGAPGKDPTGSKGATEQRSFALTEQLVQSFALNGYKRELDGQWQGIRLASDGNVYFASSTHSAHHGASFFKYDTVANEVSLLGDINTICGEDPQTNPQGKVHSDIVEANGWLYFSTHHSAEMPGSFDTWTGSHAIGYELATGTFRDYGVVAAGYSSYAAVGVDPVRNYLYVFVTGKTAGQASYIYRIDTVTGDKTNLGQVSNPSDGGWDYSSTWMFVDQRGDVWFGVSNQGGDLQQIHGDTGVIEVHANALPPIYRWDSNQVDSDATVQAARSIHWMQPLDGDHALLTLRDWGGMLYKFDSTQPMATAFTALRHIGFSYLGGVAITPSGDRVYWYQRENRAYGNQDFQDFHLMSVATDEANGYPITDHGLMKDQDGRVAWRTPGMRADGQGHVYMIGDWYTIAADVGVNTTLRYDWNGGNEIYEELNRGQFFTVANTTVPAQAPTDLAITNTDSVDPVAMNGNVSYTIQVTNNAATTANGLTVTDLFPGSVTFVSASSPSGACGNYIGSATCRILSLAPGATATMTVVLKPTAAGTLTNTASVFGNEFDPNTADNSASQTTTAFETVQFSSTAYTVAESGASATITVARTGTGAISVNYATGNNTATAGSDYTATSGTLNWAVGEGSKTFTVPITNDTSAEGNESINLMLSGAVNALLGQTAQAILTITDNDTYTPPTIAFTAANFDVSETAGTRTVTLKRTGDTAPTVGVTWSAASNTAILGTDFTAAGGVLTFGPGVTSQSFIVSITNDTAAEGNESGRLILSTPTGGAKLGTIPNASLTITDNDVSSSGFKFSATSSTTSESGSKVVTIQRTSSTVAQSVTFSTSDGTATAGADYTAVTQVVSFAAGETSKTVSVPILSDTLVEANESINMTLSNPTAGGTLGQVRTAIIWITDNDFNGTLQFKYATFSISEAGPTVTITVNRTSGTDGAIGVSYATSNNTATAGSDYTATSGTVSFTSGKTSATFTIRITNDTAVEGAESLNLTLSNPTGGATLGQMRTSLVTITDND